MLVVLGALVIDQIIAGYCASKIRKSIEHIEDLLERPASLFTSRAELDVAEPFETFLLKSQDILIVGISLVSTVGPLRTLFRTLIGQGASLRFLLLDPDSSYLGVAAQSHRVSAESLRNDISATMLHLNQLVGSADSSKGGSIQFRLLTSIPNMSFVMRDGNRINGEIRCELYLYQTDTTERPAFRLTPDDEIIYRRYRDSIERLWSDSKVPESS